MPSVRAALLAGICLLGPAVAVPQAADRAARRIDARLRKMAAAAATSGPLIRIGLESARSIRLSAGGGLRIVDPATGRDAWRAEFSGEIVAVVHGAAVTQGELDEVPSVYRVQVGAFSSREAAQQERRLLGERYGVEAVVRHDPDRGNWRLRLGNATDREALQPLMERLRAEGRQRIWIAEEPLGDAGDRTVRLVDENYDDHDSGVTRLVVTSANGRVEVDGKAYRGLIEVRVTRFGRLRAINWVGLETYLLGVVPAELGPEMWPRLEALKAQAVAARTYAARHMGQFEEDGFDLCSTPRCQVYEGAGAEHPLSNRAVQSTSGEVLVHGGEPIDAYYTATCGGHTENVELVFTGESAPYLRGVACRAEEDAMRSLAVEVSGRSVAPRTDETGRDVTRDRALLGVAGVVAWGDDAELGRPLVARTLRRFTGALAARAGRPAPVPVAEGEAGGESLTLGAASARLLRDLGWDQRAAVLVAAADLPALVRDPAAAALPEPELRAVGYLASIGALAPRPDGTFGGGDPVTAARLLPALVRIGGAYRAFGLREAVVSRVRGRRLVLVEGKGERRLELAPDAALFGSAGGRAAPASSLRLWPGDRIRYRAAADDRVDFLELIPPLAGVSDDRSSRLYRWETRRTRRELERAINRRLGLGTLQDLQVVRRGVSGRVAELRVVGSEGSSVVRGFDVRRLLGLRESLIVIEPQRDADGRISAVVFAGKGWGHGVGLCQVGAFGMAVRGEDYRAILSHYYPGARLRK